MCATCQCPHERHSCHVEKHCVKISHDLRGIFHSAMFERSRSGYCDLKGFQDDLSAVVSFIPIYVFLDRKNVRKYFLINPLLAVCMKMKCWVKFRSRAKFDAEWIGSTLGDPWDL